MGRTVLGEAWSVGGTRSRVERASQAATNNQRPGVRERGGPEQRQVQHERLRACVRVLRGSARAWQNLTNGTKYKFTESTGTYISSAIMSELVDKYQFQYKVGILVF